MTHRAQQPTSVSGCARALLIGCVFATLGGVQACASAQKQPAAAEPAPSAEAPAAAPASEAPAADSAPADTAVADVPRPAADGAVSAPAVTADDLRALRVIGMERARDSTFRSWGTNPTVDVARAPAVAFGADVDIASWALARAALHAGRLPPADGIRVEEVTNALHYGWPAPSAAAFSVVAEAFPSPNRRGYHVLVLGLRGRTVAPSARPAAHVVVVVDVSGSMGEGGRLALVKRTVRGLASALRADDTIAVVLAGDTARVALPVTVVADRDALARALDALAPQGSTNLQAALRLGFSVARQHAAPAVTSRVFLLSDGLATAGPDEADAIFDGLQGDVSGGAALHVVGIGQGPIDDANLGRLAQLGHGQSLLVTDEGEADAALATRLDGLLVPLAHDVKVQVQFDGAGASRYRLIGFENRRLGDRSLVDPSETGGVLGAGQEMTALFEVKLRPGSERIGLLRVASRASEDAAVSRLEVPLERGLVRASIADASPQSRLAWVATAWGEKLRASYWVRNLTWSQILGVVEGLPRGLRERADVRELVVLVKKAAALDVRPDRFERSQPLATMDFDALPRELP